MEITAKTPRAYRKRKLTVSEQLIQKGMEKGIEKGMEMGEMIMIQKYAQKLPHLSATDIANFFDLPVEWVEKALKAV